MPRAKRLRIFEGNKEKFTMPNNSGNLMLLWECFKLEHLGTTPKFESYKIKSVR